MRLGLIGLGRIGSFHADTLSRLPAVDTLVVTDAVPAVTKSVAERVGAEVAVRAGRLGAATIKNLARTYNRVLRLRPRNVPPPRIVEGVPARSLAERLSNRFGRGGEANPALVPAE